MLQDTPTTPLLDEGQCGGDIGCLTNIRQNNAQITLQNNAIQAHNGVLAGQRAQCDMQLAALQAQMEAEKAKKMAEMAQNLAKAMPGGGGGGDKKDGAKDGDKEGDKGLDSGKDDGQGKGNDQAKGSIEGSAQKIAGMSTNGGAVTGALQKYKSARASCMGDQAAAAEACNSQNSPEVAKGMSGVKSAPSGTAGGNIATKEAGVVDQTGVDTLQNFVNACRPVNESCKSSCGDANKALDELKSAASSAQPIQPSQQAALQAEKSKLNSAIDQEKNASDKTSVAGKEKTCADKNAKTMASAMDGIGKMLQALAGAMAANGATAPTNLPTVAGAADCNVPDMTTGQLPQTPECVCARNPRAGGCDQAAQAAGSSSSMAGLGSDASTSTTAPVSLPTGEGSPELGAAAARDSSGTTPGGAAGGAGVGGGGGGFGGGGPGTGSGADGRKGLDANILGGAGGGSGSGGSSGWGGGVADDKYRDYLPGGKRDPASMSAAAAAWNREVSGGGGKSNWDKIKERYRDAKPTFLSN